MALNGPWCLGIGLRRSAFTWHRAAAAQRWSRRTDWATARAAPRGGLALLHLAPRSLHFPAVGAWCTLPHLQVRCRVGRSPMYRPTC